MVSTEPLPSIFVSVASYRDPECQYTLRDLFERAKYPERITVGVCWQVSKDDDACFLVDLNRWEGQIRTLFLHHVEAKGPCYARALVQRHLFRKEHYFCQIDSHLRFVQDWDEVALGQLHRCQSQKPVLTSHLSSYTLPKDYKPGGPDQACLNPMKAPSVMCAESFGDATQDDKFLRVRSRTSRLPFGSEPTPALFWTARFSFSSGRVVEEVPYDPHLDYIFFGEEIAQTVRLWTNGWDLFNLTENVGYHITSRAHRPWFREVEDNDDKVRRELAAKARICGLLELEGAEPPEAPYGLGSARSLADYERFAGVGFREQSISDRAQSGGLDLSQRPPKWAEELMRESANIAEAKQLTTSPEIWAGKGSVAATPASVAATAAKVAPLQRDTTVEREHNRELARLRVSALQAKLSANTAANCSDMDEDEIETAAARLSECELELSLAFSALGDVEESHRQTEAYTQALRYAESSRARNGFVDSPLLSGSLARATSTALVGMQRYDQAKLLLREALPLAVEALMGRGSGTDGLAGAIQLAHDVLESIHVAHEQTDDRDGLVTYMKDVALLLKAIQQRSGCEEPPAPIPILHHAEQAPLDGKVTARARLFERVVLICIATGRSNDMEVAKLVYTSFAEARESPNTRRLLGMLQSSGHFLGS